MQKDIKNWTVFINRHHLNNWSVGIDYYYEVVFQPVQAVAKVCQINLLFFNITITRWGNKGWI